MKRIHGGCAGVGSHLVCWYARLRLRRFGIVREGRLHGVGLLGSNGSLARTGHGGRLHHVCLLGSHRSARDGLGVVHLWWLRIRLSLRISCRGPCWRVLRRHCLWRVTGSGSVLTVQDMETCLGTYVLVVEAFVIELELLVLYFTISIWCCTRTVCTVRYCVHTASDSFTVYSRLEGRTRAFAITRDPSRIIRAPRVFYVLENSEF